MPLVERQRNPSRNIGDHCRPAGLLRAGCEKILPHFHKHVGTTMRLGMTVHRRVEFGSRLGLVVANRQAKLAEQPNSMARSTIVLVVE